jgi:hypothetical protein
VEVIHTGAAGKYLAVDSIAVLGEFPSTLASGKHDDTDADIVYEPGPFWVRGAATGYYNNTYSYARNAGTLVQVSVSGNALTLYQLSHSGGSRNVRFCLVVEGISDNSLQCANFSQNSSSTMVSAPVTLYGFGSGTHNVVIENRDHGYLMLIDALETP